MVSSIGSSSYTGSYSSAQSTASSRRSEMQEKLFSKLDSNGDGQLSSSELDVLAKAAPQGMQSLFSGSDSAFTQSDTNGDGSLSVDEFKSAMQQVEQQLHSQFQQMRIGGAQGGPPSGPPPGDGDGDGDDTQAVGSTQASSRQQKLFDKLDTDQDGQVSAAELKAASDTAPAGLAQLLSSSNLMSSSDSDGNGSLSLDEFKSGMKQVEQQLQSQFQQMRSEGRQPHHGGGGGLAGRLLAALDQSSQSTTSSSTLSIAA
ncbi:EF-hand domain-containing protein [Chitinivorax sp. PXF-14]|uniref:EF-hand domain-containing protein n=1 Tax=Chitinivorax sp. PXF-14 TaxID=3230488 RepID=UPI003465E5DB